MLIGGALVVAVAKGTLASISTSTTNSTSYAFAYVSTTARSFTLAANTFINDNNYVVHTWRRRFNQIGGLRRRIENNK